MPTNQRKPESSEMEPDASPSMGPRDLSRGGSLESRSSSSRSRSFTLDDESLRHLTHEEKDVLQFFEDTIDSLEEDLEEQELGDNGAPGQSPSHSGQGSAGDHVPSDTAFIDLVSLGHTAEGEAEPLPDAVVQAEGAASVRKNEAALDSGVPDTPEEAQSAPSSPEALPPALADTGAPSSPRRELLSPTAPAEHPKLARSVPTPLVLAQQISEKLSGDEALSPTSPWREGRRTPTFPAPRLGEPLLGGSRSATLPAPKLHRFPSNISVTNSAGRDFSQTISKAAVSVQERKARVLANINGVAFPSTGGMGDRAGPSDPVERVVREPTQDTTSRQQSRAVQTDQPPTWANGFQSLHEVLRSEPAPFVSTGKTVTFRPEPSASSSRLARQQAGGSMYEPRPPTLGTDATRPRSGSLPRAVGFRPQGITVQFSGRGSTEEARREALRKLGLLKDHL